MLKEFPWLWALHSLWLKGTYRHIFVERAHTGAFYTVINKNYKVKIWLKLTSFDDTYWVQQLPSEQEKTVAQIIVDKIPGIFKDEVTLDYIAMESNVPRVAGQNSEERVLTIYKKPKSGDFKDVFAPLKTN